MNNKGILIRWLLPFLILFSMFSNAYSNPTILFTEGKNGLDATDGKFVQFKSKLFFAGEDEKHGQELWEYDGYTPPKMVADLDEGLPSSVPRDLIVFQSKLFFFGTNGFHNLSTDYTLWEYDGISPPKRNWDVYHYAHRLKPVRLTVFNSKLYIFLRTFEALQIWISDGVNEPVMLEKASSLNLEITSPPIAFNSKLYFIAGSQLWAFDGINPPLQVTYIKRGVSEFSNSIKKNQLVVFKNKLYFAADDDINGNELWVYDGVSPARMVADINTEPYDGCNVEFYSVGSSNPNNLTVYNSKLYFNANLQAYYCGNDGKVAAVENPQIGGADIWEYNENLWEYDGINPPKQVTVNNKALRNAEELQVFKSLLYLRVGGKIWAYDGKDKFESVITQDEVHAEIYEMSVVNSKLLFMTNDEGTDRTWWSYNGPQLTSPRPALPGIPLLLNNAQDNEEPNP